MVKEDLEKAKSESKTDNQHNPHVKLQVQCEPNTEKQKRIVETLCRYVSEISYDGDLGAFTNELVDTVFDELRTSDINTQKAYVWQVFGQFIHVKVEEVGETSVGEDEDIVDVIRDLDESEFEWFKRGIDATDEEYLAFCKGHWFSKK
ncbi:hypothetical protein [Halorussus sp. AFM4]|uniref:hypothetical protein n=1 Tax=Halorussus sp. AFM4 TaxID=3421651 RepID=UPI003EB76EEF